MWFFRSPKIVFGEDALCYLEQIQGKRAFIVTDRVMGSLGFVKNIENRLAVAEIQTARFEQVEPEPSLETVQACTKEMRLFEPDWVIGLGGGSCLDASKVAWFLYERPDVDPRAINPVEDFGLRTPARLIAIPTTAGSGSEVSQAAMIRDQQDHRKLYMASYEIIPDLTIVDTLLSAHMPPQLTADSGIDVLTHAMEGITICGQTILWMVCVCKPFALFLTICRKRLNLAQRIWKPARRWLTQPPSPAWRLQTRISPWRTRWGTALGAYSREFHMGASRRFSFRS
jgi:alcohol dehydrogenase